MNELERDLLNAFADLAIHQRELYPRVATAVGFDPYEYWMIQRSRYPAGRLDRFRHWWRRNFLATRTLDRAWRFWFHGYELDVENLRDGRRVRIDFGTLAKRLVLTGWGAYQYVMTVQAPWRTYPALRAHFAHDQFRCLCELEDSLTASGLLEPCGDASTLACEQAFVAKRLVLSPKANDLR